MAKGIHASGPQRQRLRQLGEAIRETRKQLGLTQEELAWRAGKCRTYLADIERGARNPTLGTIEALAKALQVTVGSLLLPAGKPDSRAAPPEVLMVEDSTSDAELTARAFARAQFANPLTVLPTAEMALDYLGLNGRSALAELRILPLILLDLHLPGMSGIELLRRLKASPLTREIPVVILTHSLFDLDIIQCGRLGADNYLVKPVASSAFRELAPKLRLRWAMLPSS